MSKSDYLKRYLGQAEAQSDYKSAPSKKKKSKLKSQKLKPKPKTKIVTNFSIVDNDLLGWDDKNLSKTEDRAFTDIGIDAPTIFKSDLADEKRLGQEKAKWKKPVLSKEKRARHDSSDSESDSDADVDRDNSQQSNSSSKRSKSRSGRKRRHDSSSSSSSSSSSNNGGQSSSDSDIDVRSKMADGGKAGLNTANEFSVARQKVQANAYQIVKKGQESTVFRDKAGRAQHILDKRKADEEAAKKKLESKEKWDKWSAGVVTGKLKAEHKENVEHEISKPLARLADDEDLNNYQKSITRLDDPMLKYFKDKEAKDKKKRGHFPEYKGPPPAPNRFAIKPGYRWDGVDRSNSFEKRFFERKASLHSLKEHEIRYMTEDM